MSWHYRIGHMKEADEDIYGIVEYFDDLPMEVEKKGVGWTDFVHPRGESIESLRHDLVMMLNDTYRDEPLVELEGER